MNEPYKLSEWISFPIASEERGVLGALDFSQLPFDPQRIFYITDVPPGTVRGGHAHLKGRQLFVTLAGRVEVHLRKNEVVEHVICSNNGQGLLINEGIWAKQIYLDAESIALVLCSHPYDENNYQY